MTGAYPTLEPRLMLAAIVLYAIACGLNLWAVLMGHARVERVSRAIALAALLVQGVAILLRWSVTGHGPYLTRYEVLEANAWVTMALFTAVSWRMPRLRPASIIVYPAVLLLSAVGLYTGPQVRMLPPTFTGVWLVLHVCFYFVSFTAALTAVACALLHLAGDRRPGALAQLPEPGELDRLSHRFAGVAFAFWGIGMLTGSIWAYYSWGRYWGWDPVESWSLLTWLMFGLYLHLRRFHGWRGARAAWLLVTCFALALVSLFGTSLVAGSLHAAYFR